MSGHRGRLSILSVSLAFAVAVAACGGDDDDAGDGASASTTGAVTTAGGSAATTAPARTTAAPAQTAVVTAATTAAPTDVDPNGVLRLGQSLIPISLEFDLTKAGSGTHQMLDAVYGSILRKTRDGEYQPGLATAVTVVDPQTIQVVLRPNLVFSDGTPADAQAFKFNVERLATVGNTRGLRAEILRDLDNVEVTGTNTATVHLKSATAGVFFDLFAGPETMMMSPTAIQSGVDFTRTPIGAGPFVVTSVEPEARLVMAKNPKYWDAANIKLAGLEYIHLTAGQPLVTALQAGAIDATALTPTLAQAISAPNVTETIPHPAMFILNMCKRDGPLSDVRVRQALSYAMDRNLIAQRAYLGQTEPAWSLRRAGDPYHNPALEGRYARDLDKARQLLAEAGYADGFETTMMGSPGTSILVGELLQAQWAEIGVDLRLTETSNPTVEFYVEGKAAMFPISHTRVALDALTVLFLPGAFANVCGHSNPELEAKLAETMAFAPDTAQAADGWKALAEIVADDLPIIPIVFHVEVVAHNPDRVGDIVWMMNHFGSKVPDVTQIYIKK